MIRGLWAWAWGANIAYLWAILFYGWVVEWSTLLLLGSAWTVWFALQEGVGIWRNVLADRRGESELARTYSQVMQWFGNKDKGSRLVDVLTGWDLFVTGNCVVAGSVAGYLVGRGWFPALGWVVGVIIAGAMFGHWHNNRRHG